MDIYTYTDSIPLSFSRVRNNSLVTGLQVAVAVTNAKTGASLLASTAMTEASGVYTYNWTPGITADTECLVTYSVGSTPAGREFIFISNSPTGSRAAY